MSQNRGGGGPPTQNNTPSLNNNDVLSIFNQQFLGNLQDNPPTDIIPSIDGAPSVTLDNVHNRLLDVEEMVDQENKTVYTNYLKSFTPNGTIQVQNDIVVDPEFRLDVTQMRLLASDVSAGQIVLATDTGGTLGYGISGGTGTGGGTSSSQFNTLSGVVYSNVSDISGLEIGVTALSGRISSIETLSGPFQSLSAYTQDFASISGVVQSLSERYGTEFQNISGVVYDLSIAHYGLETEVDDISSRINQISGIVIADLSAIVYSLSEQIANICGWTVLELCGYVGDLFNDVGDVSGRIDALSGDFWTHKGGADMLSGDFRTLSAHVYSLSADVQTLNTNFQNLSSFVHSLSSDIQTDLTTLGTDLTSVSGRVETAETEIGGICGYLGLLNVGLTDLSGRVETLETGLTEVSGRVAGQTADITSISGRIAAGEVVILDLCGHVDSLDTGLTALSGRVETVEGVVVNLCGRVEGLDAGLTDVSGRIGAGEAVILDLCGHVDSLDTGLTALSGRVETVEGVVVNLCGRVEGLDAGLTDVSGRIASGEVVIVDLCGHVDSLDTGLTALSGRVETVEGVVVNLCGRVEGLDAGLTDVSGRIGAGEAVILDLCGHADRLDTGLTALSGRVETVEGVVVNLCGRVEGLDAGLTALSGRVTDLSMAFYDLSSRVADIGASFSGLSAEFYVLSGVVQDLCSIVGDLSVECGATRVGLVDLSGRVAGAEVEIGELSGVAQDLSGRMGAAEAGIGDVSGRVDTLEDMSGLIQSTAGLSGVVWDLSARMGVAEVEIGEISGVAYRAFGLSGVVYDLSARMVVAELEIGELSGVAQDLSGRMGAAEAGIGDVSGRVAGLETDVLSLSGRVDTLETEMGEVSGVAYRAFGLSGVVWDLSARMGVAESDIYTVSGLIWEVSGVVAGVNAGLVDLSGRVFGAEVEIGELSGVAQDLSARMVAAELEIDSLSGVVYDLCSILGDTFVGFVSLSGVAYDLSARIVGLSDATYTALSLSDELWDISGRTTINTLILEVLYTDVQDISARLGTICGGGGGVGDVTQGEFQEVSGIAYNLSGMVQDMSAQLYTISNFAKTSEFQEVSGIAYTLSDMVWDMSAYLYTVSGSGSGGPTGYPTLGEYGPYVGISAEYTVANNFYKVDSFLHEKFLMPPPAPNLSGVERLGVITNLDQYPPTQIELGILDIKIPYIRRWLVDVSLADAPHTQIFSNYVDLATTRIAFVAFDSNNNQDGSTQQITDLSQQQTQSVAIAGENQNDVDTLNYLALDVSFTTTVGVPSPPQSLSLTTTGTNSASTSWTAPADNDVSLPGNQTVPPISNYRVTTTTTGATTSIVQGNTASNALTTASTSQSLNSTQLPYAGTDYRVLVEARNTLNANYGEGISDELTTNTPTNLQSAPFGSLSFTTDGTMGTYSGTVYDLSGTNGFSRVFNWSNIGSHRVRLDVTGTKNPLSSQTLYSLSGRFVSTGATSRSLSGFEFRGEESNSGGLTNGTIERTGIVTLNDAVVPTGLSFSATNTQNTGAWISVDDVVSFADQYTASATKGFYTKQRYAAEVDLDTKATALGVNLYGQNLYGLRLGHEYLNSGGGSTSSNTAQYSQALDQLIGSPALSQHIINGVTATTGGGGLQYVTGVPSIDSNATISHVMAASNLARFFLPSNGVHTEYQLEAGESNDVAKSSTYRVTRSITSVTPPANSTLIPGSLLYRDASSNVISGGGSLLPDDGSEVQFWGVTSSLNSGSLWSEQIRGNARASNILGTSSYVNGEVLDGGVNKNLRTDTTSISALSSLNGTLVVAGTGQYPDYGTGAGEFGDTYDHTEAIVSNADTRQNEQLQMVGGKFWSVSAGRSNSIPLYRNQDTATAPYQYYNGTVDGPDQSVISEDTNWRYVVLKQGSVIGSNTYRVVLTMSAAGFTAQNDADHRLNIRVVNSGTEETGWLDATTLINPALDLTANKDTNGIGVLALDTVSTGTVRYCDFPVTNGGDLYVRLGIRNDSSNKTFTNLSVSVSNA